MLAASRAMFLAVGGLWTMIGVAAGFLVGRRVGPVYVFASVRADTALFGGPPDSVLAGDPNLAMLKVILIRAMSGLMLAAGILVLAIAWFGLREPQQWALIALTAAGLSVLPYWWFTLAPYRSAGYALRLSDIPPFMWVPAILVPVGAVLGWAARSG